MNLEINYRSCCGKALSSYKQVGPTLAAPGLPEQGTTLSSSQCHRQQGLVEELTAAHTGPGERGSSWHQPACQLSWAHHGIAPALLEAYQEQSCMLSPPQCPAQDLHSCGALQSYDYSLEKMRDHSNPILKTKMHTWEIFLYELTC